jgi:hypothetical protein
MSIQEVLMNEVYKLSKNDVSRLLTHARVLKANRHMCGNCTREKSGNRCSALNDRNYPFEKHGECWAWTDDPRVEDKIKKAAAEYSGCRG